MKKIRFNKISKRKRIAYIVLAGVILILTTALISKVLIKTDNEVYQPDVTSNYQPEEDSEDIPMDDVGDDSVPDPESTPTPATEWPVTYSSDQAASLTVIVNKKHRLPSSYTPTLNSVAGGQMRPEAATALQNLLNAAQSAGNPMIIVSSYRSYQTQVSTYQYWVDTQGQAQADRESARPGHSEHQTGLAVDLGNPDGSCRLLACFGSGSAGQWLAANAHKYGFVIRYPDGKESITGYIYEPWHIRYLGDNVANSVKNSGQTLEEYYDIEGGGY